MAGAEQAKNKNEKMRPAELSFFLVCGDRPAKACRLVGLSEKVSIGRASGCDLALGVSSVSAEHCEIFLKKRNRDPVLCVRDLSRNGTGVRHSKAARADSEFCEVRKDEVEVLQHKSELLVPARQNSRAMDTRTIIKVLFELPDAYDPQQNTGRWDYEEKLGEGGLAVVYRARDMAHEGSVVAVKISKFGGREIASTDNRHIYALHREAQWSINRLHCTAHERYERGGADLFARYLEDHTGFGLQEPKGDFDGLRKRFEDPSFNWAKHEFDPPIAEQPYVVLDFVDGKLLQHIIDKGPPLDNAERTSVIRQCCKALVYMERFGVLHRDFRGCNIFLKGRGAYCRVQVIDLGFMITADLQQERNPNSAVRTAWQDDPERKVRFDWAPPEVRVPRAPNFGLPPFSFDVYSFGVLALKLLKGRGFTQAVLQGDDFLPMLRTISAEIEDIGLTVNFLAKMLDRNSPEQRPLPSVILHRLNAARRGGGAASSTTAGAERSLQSSPPDTTHSLPEPAERPEPARVPAAPDAAAGSGPAAKRPRLATAGGADAQPMSAMLAMPAGR